MTPGHSNPPPSFFLDVDPTARKPIYQQLTDAVADAVASGAARAGDPLPSVRELAVELRINLNTVSRAYRSLQDLGLVTVKRGVGVFIADSVETRPVETRLETLAPELEAVAIQARQLDLPAEIVLARLAQLLGVAPPATTNSTQGEKP